MTLLAVWAQAEALRQKLRGLSEPAALRAAAGLGLNAPGWALLLCAQLVAPQAISASRLSGLNPYVNPWIYEAGLQHLAGVGLLAEAGPGEYAVAPAGQSAMTAILYAGYDCLRAQAPAIAAALGGLAEPLERLVTASLLAPEPPRKALLRLSHELAGVGPPDAVVRLDQALADLAAYRDDAHLAAWQPHMVSGQAWDALSTLWRGTPGTLDDVYARMARRGWPREAVARAVQELVRHDWVRGPEPYTLTPHGRVVRDRAEMQTNTYFFGPWEVLGPDALEGLNRLLNEVHEVVGPL